MIPNKRFLPVASQQSTGRKSKLSAPPEGYFEWSRDPAVGFFVVLPLWLVYEVLRHFYVPHTMNLAEFWVKEQFYTLPPIVLDLYGISVLAGVLIAAWSLLRRDIPWLRVGMVVVLEGSVYGLMLGPIAAQLTKHSLPVLQITPVEGQLFADIIGSLGAGIFEELMFRLILLSGLSWLFMRVSRSFGIPRAIGVGVAVLASSLLFSLFHHFGMQSADVEPRVFVFRTMAGVLLGVLFITRGLGVCVYTHAMYDVFFYLSAHD
jgi:membrane protease YdiL (CAAX protease family)